MTEKLKLPVSVMVLAPLDNYCKFVVDADEEPIPLLVIAAALNATARRCDGCKHWYPLRGAFEGTQRGDCMRLCRHMHADDCCRRGWTPRDEPKGKP
jgi:hypothetical protein